MAVKTLERECFCGSRKGEILHKQQMELYEGHLLPKSYDVVSCLECGFIFADTPAPQSVYDEYYKNFSKYEQPDVGEQLYIKKSNAQRLSGLLNGNTAAKILDIGCGGGGKLLNLKKLGFTNLYGLDPSSDCVENLRENGIIGIHGSIFATGIEEKFDMITLDAVLEHIVDLNRLMQKVSGILNKGGFLSITVPDACRYDEIKENTPFSAFNTEHINHFDFNSLARLGIRFGLCVHEFEDNIDYTIEKNISCTYIKPNIETVSAKSSVLKHIEKSAEHISSMSMLLPEDEDIVIWGAGNHLSRLIAFHVFDKCNILGFIDNDRHKTGRAYMGSQIYTPDFLNSVSAQVTVVICAENYSEAIRTQILDMGLKNKIVSL